MSCGCNDNAFGYSPYGSACAPELPYPQVSSESVPSLINNLTYSLYGTITKSIVNSQIVWTTPCDPNSTATINGFPRNNGEGLLCYLLRYFNYIATNGTTTINFSGNLSGDVTGTQTTTSVVKVNGLSLPISATAIGTNSSGQLVNNTTLIPFIPRSINTISSPTYTFTSGDLGSVTFFTSSSATTATIPPYSSVPFAYGQRLEVIANAAGKVHIVAGSGVTINSANGTYLRTQYSSGYLIYTGVNQWNAVGDFATS